MLSDTEFVLFACILLGANTLGAIVMWWRYPRLWAPCSCVLATTVGIVLYVPIRLTCHKPSGDFDGFGIVVEFVLIGGVLAVIHFGSVLILCFDEGDR